MRSPWHYQGQVQLQLAFGMTSGAQRTVVSISLHIILKLIVSLFALICVDLNGWLRSLCDS